MRVAELSRFGAVAQEIFRTSDLHRSEARRIRNPVIPSLARSEVPVRSGRLAAAPNPAQG